MQRLGIKIKRGSSRPAAGGYIREECHCFISCEDGALFTKVVDRASKGRVFQGVISAQINWHSTTVKSRAFIARISWHSALADHYAKSFKTGIASITVHFAFGDDRLHQSTKMLLHCFSSIHRAARDFSSKNVSRCSVNGAEEIRRCTFHR